MVAPGGTSPAIVRQLLVVWCLTVEYEKERVWGFGAYYGGFGEGFICDLPLWDPRTPFFCFFNYYYIFIIIGRKIKGKYNIYN